MKRMVILFVALLALSVFAGTALANENAYDHIHVYNQPNYTSQKYGNFNMTVYRSGKATTLKDIGCNLFTYAHAIQWLEHTSYSTQEQYWGLLSQLVKICNTPSESRNGYVSYMTKTLGYAKTSVTRSEEWLKTFFDQGGCIRVHIYWQHYGDDRRWDSKGNPIGGGGHYFLAIGYTVKNGTFYIQMLDSNPWSTVNRIECRDFSSFAITKNSSTGHNQYWIPLSRFSQGYVVYNNRKAAIEFLEGYYPNNSITATTLEFRNVVYPQQFKIDTTNGWNLQGGVLVSDQPLSTLFVKIINENGDVVSQMATPRQLSGNRFYISSLDGEGKDNGQKFSKITTPGKYYWVMTATDTSGRPPVTIEMPITAVTDKSTVTATMSSGDSVPTPTETEIKGIYRFIKADDSRSGPGEAYSKVADQSEGSIVFVVASVVNQYNYTWYKLENGSYVYSGDVEKVTLTETSLSGTYIFNKNDESRTWPYEASSLVTSYSKGSSVEVTKRVVNTYGNAWYKLSTGAYVYSGDLDSATAVSTLRFRDVVYPSVYVLDANGWYLKGGTVESDYELETIKTEIKKGSTVVSSKTRSISGYSYTIKSLDTGATNEDNGVRFSYIKNKGYGTGSYVWILTATDAKGRTLTLEMPFQAVSSGSTSTTTVSLSYNDLNRPVTAVSIEDVEGLDYTNGEYVGYGYDNTTSFILIGRTNPEDASNSTLAWTSSDESVVKLLSTENVEGGTVGYFTRTGVGSATITASAQDGSGKKATVSYKYYMTNIALSAMDPIIQVNQYTSVIPTMTPSIASYADLTWWSSDPSVVTVDEYGVVKGIGKGNATIYATALDGSNVFGTCTITVNSNISNLQATMWDVPYPISEMDSCNVAIHPVMKGEEFTLYTSWDFDTYSPDYDFSFTLDDESGLRTATGETAVNGSFVAETSGTWNVYFNLFENNLLVEQMTIPITVTNDARTIVPDTEYVNTIMIAGTKAYYSFVPDTTGTYVFSSLYDGDSIGYLYDCDWNLIGWSDDAGYDNNFRIICELEAGEKYYLGAGLYDRESTGFVTVKLTTYRPVSWISVGTNDMMPGEIMNLRAYGMSEDGYMASVYECYWDLIDNEVCSVSENGLATAKSNGLTGVTVYSYDNPGITARMPIYVHGDMNYDVSAEVDQQGIVTLSFNGNAYFADDMFTGFYLKASDLDAPFRLTTVTIPGFATKNEYNVGEDGTGKIVHDMFVLLQSEENILSTDDSAAFRLIPDNIDEIYGTTQEYTFVFSPVYHFEGQHYLVYGAEHRFTLSVAYPERTYGFVAPSALEIIEDEAFSGLSAETVRLSENVTVIKDKAFAYCNNLRYIYIPESCTSIARNAFEGKTRLIICGRSGSKAETFAAARGFTFIPVKTIAERIQQFLATDAEYQAYDIALDLNNDGKISNEDYAIASH